MPFENGKEAVGVEPAFPIRRIAACHPLPACTFSVEDSNLCGRNARRSTIELYPDLVSVMAPVQFSVAYFV